MVDTGDKIGRQLCRDWPKARHAIRLQVKVNSVERIPMTVELNKYRDAILRIAADHGARNVRVFGSAARGTSSETSDIDLLVAMEPGRTLLDLVALNQDLEDALGRSVDVVTEGGLSPYLRDRILAEAIAL